MSNSLTTADIVDIRRMHAEGVTAITLAEVFNVNRRTIHKIVSGERWSSIPQDQIIKTHPNYAVTADGRVWSFTKRNYLVTDTVGGQEQVRLSKTLRNGNRTYTRMAISDLVKTYFN